jgi:hypothetical protein
VSSPAPDPADVEQGDDLLFAGEERRDELSVGDARLLLTTHRLLVTRSEGDPRFRAVDLPNVLDVSVETTGGRWPLALAAQAGLLGVVGVSGGLVLPDRLVERPSVEPASGLGLDGLFETMATILGLVALLDEALLAVGVLGVLAAAALLAWALVSRDRLVVVGVSGGDPIELASTDPGADRDRVARLLES